MAAGSPLHLELRARLRCPACRGTLADQGKALTCVNPECAEVYPIVGGVPVLIEAASHLRPPDLPPTKVAQGTLRVSRPLRRWIEALRPSISANLKAVANYRTFRTLLRACSPNPLVLVLGGRVVGEGMGELLDDPSVRCIETDVSFGPRTHLLCDGQRLPFDAEGFDGAVIQGALYQLVDPFRCAREIHRVLKPTGLVYAESPFMQQVTGGRSDFFRFTHLGHRRVFRDFEEVSSGAVGGPGMALAWAYKYLLLSLTTSRRLRVALDAFADFSAFWLTFLDRYLLDRPGTYDAAAGFYFLGRKAAVPISDAELVRQYRGLIR